MSWVFSTILSLRAHQIAKLIAVHELTGAVVPYIALKEVAHGMVCLSESHQGLNFRDVISAMTILHFHLRGLSNTPTNLCLALYCILSTVQIWIISYILHINKKSVEQFSLFSFPPVFLWLAWVFQFKQEEKTHFSCKHSTFEQFCPMKQKRTTEEK